MTFAKNKAGITFYFGNKEYTVPSSHMNFRKIVDAVVDGAYELAISLQSVAKAINAAGKNAKRGRNVFVEKGEVYYNDITGRKVKLGGRLADDIIRENANSDPTALMNFLDLVRMHPLKHVREELYLFTQAGSGLPITVEGHILAFKKVRADFKDIYSGTMDNSPGKVVEMPREKVDTNRHNTCSVGLHFAAHSYLQHYGTNTNGGTKVLVVSINPLDVLSIPSDYDNTKGRACRYEVVGEINERNVADAFKSAFINDKNRASVAPTVTWHAPAKLDKSKTEDAVQKQVKEKVTKAAKKKVRKTWLEVREEILIDGTHVAVFEDDGGLRKIVKINTGLRAYVDAFTGRVVCGLQNERVRVMSIKTTSVARLLSELKKVVEK